MAKTIKLQEEFEALINELERLKSINEITSKNSENAKKTIDEIESFVQSVQIFKTSIENDYQSKKNDFEVIKKSLNDALITLSSNVSDQSHKFETLANNYEESTNQTLDSVLDKFQKKVDTYSAELKSLKEVVSEDFSRFSKSTSGEIDINTKKLNKSITDSQSRLLEQLQLVDEKENEVLRQMVNLSSKLDMNRKKIDQLLLFVVSILIVTVVSFGFMMYKLL
ncbi:hypothetical protein [Gelidibacter pelagius]|uniref:Uncharacterized protein n=1 Tax=Gelidibacter pelagius TaxID=2819985 RepID=A0ABS3SRL0_9FLAO|nr:hypothetical protein [Gelidibacter pelagius]MBO3098284.1 hypothetical protein [Gelidibacter pelagius]